MLRYLLIFFFITELSFAQNINLKINVSDKFQNPVMGVTIISIEQNDDKIQLSDFSDSLGNVNFIINNYGKYLIKLSSIGYKSIESVIDVDAKKTFFTFTIEEASQTLDELTVVAKKPLMRQVDDMTIIDPEPIANTSTNALEILEKTPGLFVDPDGNVYLNTATPASIYINGREQKMSASDVATILKSLPPNSIERIEILRTPSASMDAASTGGSVNIVLKKGVKIGRTGSVNAGLNQGKLGNQFVGVNINRSLENKSSFFNFNVSRRNNFDASDFVRNINPNTENASQLATNSYSTFPSYSIFSSLGGNIDLSKKWEASYDARLSYNNSNSFLENDSKISSLKLSNPTVFSSNVNNVENNTTGYSINQGLFSKYKFDDKGSELKLDISLNFFENVGHQDYNTNFTLPTSRFTSGFGDWKSNRTLFAVQTDLKYFFPHKITFESGLKSSIINFKSNTEYSKKETGIIVKDNFRTNGFNYYENISAAYVQASKTMGAFVLKIGTRLENTVMNGNQVIPKDTTFKINRTDLFPYVYFSRKLFTIANYDMRGYLVARRTIKRPGYDELNPFARFVDQYIYEAGNPALKPQFTNNYEANISFQEMPIFAFGRNYTNDIFTNVIYQDPTNPLVSYRTTDNLGSNKETYFRLVGAIPPGGKYFFVLGTQFSRNEYDGQLDSKPFTFDRSTWSFFTYHQLKIDNLSTLTLNGFFRAKGQLQFYELSNFGSLSMSINRQFLNRKLMVTLSGNDMLYTNKFNFNLNQGTVTGNGNRRSDSRRVNLNIRYNFGQRKKQEQTNMFNVGELMKE